MKKLLILLITLMMILLVFVGCDEAAREGSATTPDDRTDSKVTGADDPEACRAPKYEADDLDVFIEEWVQPQLNSAENQVNNNAADPISIVIPNLQSSEYRFMHMFVDEYNYQYYYVPLDYSDAHFRSDVGMIVYVSRTEGSFEGVVNQFELTPIDGVAYEPSDNRWIIDNDGKEIAIFFPDNVILQDASEIADYFTFETYGGTADDGTVAE